MTEQRATRNHLDWNIHRNMLRIWVHRRRGPVGNLWRAHESFLNQAEHLKPSARPTAKEELVRLRHFPFNLPPSDILVNPELRWSEIADEERNEQRRTEESKHSSESGALWLQEATWRGARRWNSSSECWLFHRTGNHYYWDKSASVTSRHFRTVLSMNEHWNYWAYLNFSPRSRERKSLSKKKKKMEKNGRKQKLQFDCIAVNNNIPQCLEQP